MYIPAGRTSDILLSVLSTEQLRGEGMSPASVVCRVTATIIHFKVSPAL